MNIVAVHYLEAPFIFKLNIYGGVLTSIWNHSYKFHHELAKPIDRFYMSIIGMPIDLYLAIYKIHQK